MFLLAIACAGASHGCSAQALKRAGYETLHNISDTRNEDDPKYEQARRTDFEVYSRQREETLGRRNLGDGSSAAPVPSSPP